MHIVQDEKVLKEIINRLNKNNGNLILFDCSDKSQIIIDDKLLVVIKSYYEDILVKNNIEVMI